MKKNTIKVFSLAIAVMLLMTSCKLPFNIVDKVNDVVGGQTDLNPTAILPLETLLPAEELYTDSFADYILRQVTLPETYTGGYTLPLSASDVYGLEDQDLSNEQVKTLLQNGFVVEPPETDPNRLYQEFYQAYESVRYDDTPVFITTDAVFHIYHLVFDKMLRDLERKAFIPTLKELMGAMLTTSVEQYQELVGTDLETAAIRNVAFFTVPALILGMEVSVPEEAIGLAQAELELIEGQSGNLSSPIWDTSALGVDDPLLEDYSQYIPRGHYTKDESLKTYFKAMMWLGRLTFRLKNQMETQRALLLIQAIRSAQTDAGTPALKLWQQIYDPTVFIVGKADDLSIYEYGVLSDQIYGEAPALTRFADEALFAQFMEAAKTLPPPQVNSMWVYIWEDRDEATKGFRFMGQRFTLDAYIFGQMIWRKVGTLDNPRDLPKGLDILAAMGSDEAYAILDEGGETDFENFDVQMTKVKTEVAGFGVDSWTQNLYWSWLYSLQPVFAVKGKQYPAFMQTQAWLRKDMHTALSSWTELKHDTILYAKQVMAEMGGGAPEEPPHGYVEPNPEAFARLLALVEMTRNGLDSRDLLDDDTRNSLDMLIDEVEMLLDISQRELNGEPISDEEYWQLQYFGGWLEMMTLRSADPADDTGMTDYLEDQKSALIADVATGVGRVLEEGVGYPTKIFVVLPETPNKIAIGAIYTYYEFPVPQDGRMTDEDWREMLESGQAPPAPDWTSLFIVP